MLRAVLAAGLVVSVVAGVGVVGLRTLGGNAKATLDTLNEALERSQPGKGRASAREVADYFERYRAGARDASCREGRNGWDYVCVFRDGSDRWRKVAVIVDSTQPTQMSPLLGVHRHLPAPSGQS
jgi:hypothetical protein